MDTDKMKAHFPTLSAYLKKRRNAKLNQLPKHLRPPAIWPIWIQIVVNTGLIVTLCNLMINRDDYLTEAGPAIVLAVCLILMIAMIIITLQTRHRYDKTRGQRLAKINVWLIVVAFLTWTASIVVFLP